MAERKAAVGSRAPDFTLPCTPMPGTNQREVSLDDYQDRWLILLFYPRDFSLVCPTELTGFSTRMHEFDERDCGFLGISTDTVETHERWIATPRNQGGLGGLRYPLAADVDGSVCKSYGVYVPKQNVALRGLFIIDPNGVLQYQVVHNLSVGRSSEEILRVVDGLQTGGMCPEAWSPGQAVLDPARTLVAQSVIGQYRIETKLGAGAFGTVFRAQDLTLQRSVALKVISSQSPTPSPMLLAEARAAAALNHPNVCTIYAVDASDGVPMIVMEFVDGQPLNSLLSNSRLSPDRARSIGKQIALGMAAAHAQSIVHGDLKPGNIMITHEGVAKVMDFGLAHRDPTKPAPPTVETGAWSPVGDGLISGTPAYMSPEQTRGETITTASDVFSLGLILVELATGKKAVDSQQVLEVLRLIDNLNAEELAAQLPEPFATAARKALVREPRERISMSQLAEILA